MPGKLPTDYEDYDPLAGITPQQAQDILQAAAPTATQTELAGAAAAAPIVQQQAQQIQTQSLQPATVMVRDGSEYGSLSQIAPPGSLLVFNADDPDLANEIADAKIKGYQYGIWVVAAAGDDPTLFAQRCAYLSATYQPSILVPNVEFVGKDAAGAAWSQTMMETYSVAAPNQKTAVAVPPNWDSSVFNYDAYTSNGTGVWVETYLGDMTPVDAQAAVEKLKASGVPESMITTLLAPGQAQTATGGIAGSAIYAPPPNYIASTGTYSQTGGFSWTPPPNQPYIPNTYIPTHGAQAGQPSTYPPGTTLPPSPDHPYGPQLPPPVGEVQHPQNPNLPASPDTSKPQSWAEYYFGSWGLEQADMNMLIQIMTKYDNVQDATMAALAYIRGTAWYGVHFAGINLGIADGLFSDESGYRDYVNSLNVYSQQYLNRQVTTADVIQSLGGAVDPVTGKIVKIGAGLSPTYVGKVWEGQAWTNANQGEVNYQLGAFGGGAPSPAELTALGQQQAGLTTNLGFKVQQKLQAALQRMQGVFGGQVSSPNMSIGAQGLNAPSLLGAKGSSPDIGA